MHLAGFIMRIYHDALSPERQSREYNVSSFNSLVPYIVAFKDEIHYE